MATQIQLTRSGTPGAQPTATEMELGELALNYADGKLYFKNDSNNIEQLNSTYNNSGQTIYVNDIDDHVGLNTTSPEYLLDLGGSSAHTNNTLRLNQNDDGTAIRIGGSTAGDITLLRVDNADGETANSAEGFSIKYLGSNNHELGIFADNTSSEVQALTILQNGNIGIGTIVPSVKLDVGGSVQVSGNLAISGNTVLGNATSDTTSISGGLTVDTDTLVVDESEDRVGINQPSPTEALDVEGNIVSSGTIDGAVITGTTLTDGTASISNGAITGATDITATGNVTGATPTADTHLTTKAYVDRHFRNIAFRNMTARGSRAMSEGSLFGYTQNNMPANNNSFTFANTEDNATAYYATANSVLRSAGVLAQGIVTRRENSNFMITTAMNVGMMSADHHVAFRVEYSVNNKSSWQAFNLPALDDNIYQRESIQHGAAVGHASVASADLNEDVHTVNINQFLENPTYTAGDTIHFRVMMMAYYLSGYNRTIYINRPEILRSGSTAYHSSTILIEEIYTQ